MVNNVYLERLIGDVSDAYDRGGMSGADKWVRESDYLGREKACVEKILDFVENENIIPSGRIMGSFSKDLRKRIYESLV